jgi:hypothetical protein
MGRQVIIAGRPSYNQVPTPRDDARQLLEAADVALPAALPLASARAATSQNSRRAEKRNNLSPLSGSSDARQTGTSVEKRRRTPGTEPTNPA